MVLKHPFFCPTRLIEGHAFDEALGETLENRRWVLVTSEGWIRRGVFDRLTQHAGEATAVLSNVEPNPTYSSIPELEAALPDADVVVALGGGSVIDAAKAIIALRGCQPQGEAVLADHLKNGVPLPDDMSPLPLVAIPTTSGTGSEVTRWGTIWGDDGIKHSVTDFRLFPTHAILDPKLAVSMPGTLTLFTALDALSHAMESIWNRRFTAITDGVATAAIAMIRKNLGPCLAAPADVRWREQLQTASVYAGLAMGTTQTALAHSISYPFTAHYEIPHGLACSFTLAEVARYNLATVPERLAPISTGLGCALEDIPETLETWFDELGLGRHLASYVQSDVTDEFGDNLITRARAANNIRDIDGSGARKLARAALDRLIAHSPRSDREQQTAE